MMPVASPSDILLFATAFRTIQNKPPYVFNVVLCLWQVACEGDVLHPKGSDPAGNLFHDNNPKKYFNYNEKPLGIYRLLLSPSSSHLHDH